MTTSEKKCKDMADVCDLAHHRTVRECNKQGIQVFCHSSMTCGDNNVHRDDEYRDDHYTADAQEVFDRHYDYICEATRI